MTLILRSSLAVVLTCVCVFAASGEEQKCRSEGVWRVEHAEQDFSSETVDVKGTRSTRIYVCRDDAATANEPDVQVRFHGLHRSSSLLPSECVDYVAKWAILSSKGKLGSDGSKAVASGTYKVCREAD